VDGDLSRGAFDPARYNRVVAQQGRVQLDSDWNEQQAIIDYRLRAMASDVFGDADLSGTSGVTVVPAARPGFGLHVHAGGAFDGVTSHDEWIASEVIGGEEPITIGAWIAPASPKQDGTFGTVVAYRRAFSIAVDKDRRVVFARSEIDPSGERDPRIGQNTLSSNTALRGDGFSFVACVFTGDAMEIWIDGALAGHRSARKGPWVDAAVRVGADYGPHNAPAYGFAGTIEEVFIRRRAMPREAILTCFVHGPAAPERAHRSRWLFHAGTGMAIEPAPHRLCAGPGRAYVAGRSCENAVHVEVPSPGPGEWLAYLDVWERYVSAFEDPALREPALGGTDTTGRVRTVAGVRFAGGGTDVDALAHADRERGRIAVELGPEPADDNLLYRFEVHAPGGAGDAAAVKVTLDEPRSPSGAGLRTLRVAGDAQAAWESGQFLVPAGGDAGSAIRVVSGDGRTFTVDGVQANVARALDVVAVATLLWSKENPHAVFALEDVTHGDGDAGAESTSIALEDEAGRADLLSIDDIVVLTDRARADAGLPGFLTTILSTSTEKLRFVDVVVAGRVPPLGDGATLRRWDGALPAVAKAAAPAAGTAAGDLSVHFATGGSYRAGDFWLAALRPTALEQLDWPTDAANAAAFVPPLGIEHVYAALAVVRVSAHGVVVERDLRHVVHSIGELSRRTELVELALEYERERMRAHDEHVLEYERELRERELREHELRELELRELELREHERRERELREREQREHERRGHERHEHVRHEHPERFVLARHAPDGYVPAGSVVDAVVERPVWRAIPPAPDSGPADAVAIGGCVYVLFANTGSLLRFDPHDAREPWSACAPYDRKRRAYALAVANGRLFLIGGYDQRGNPSALVDAYDPHHDVWAEGWTSMHVARAHPMAAATGDTVVVCGGIRGTWYGHRYATQSAELFDLSAETWRALEPMPFRRYGGAAACAGGMLYVAGGSLATELTARVRRTARVDRMNVRSGLWTEHAHLHDVRSGAHAVAVGDGEIVVAGGAYAGAERISTRGDEVRRLAWPPHEHAGLAAAGGVVYAIAGTRDGAELSDAHACTLIDRMHVYRRLEDEET